MIMHNLIFNHFTKTNYYRGMVDAETGEHFVAYFLPTEETSRKRKRDEESGVDYDPEEE